jgi:hypothetical protein
MNRTITVKTYFATIRDQKKTALTRARFWPLRLYWQASLGGDANLYVYPSSNIGARLSASVHSIYLLNFSIICARQAARGSEKKGTSLQTG